MVETVVKLCWDHQDAVSDEVMLRWPHGELVVEITDKLLCEICELQR